MPRVAYSEEKKAEIIKVSTDARAAGKKWDEVISIAKATGYQGSKQALMKLLQGTSAVKPRGKRRGRKPGSKNAPKAAAPAPADGLSAISDTVRNMVREQVAAALDDAIKSLNKIRDNI